MNSELTKSLTDLIDETLQELEELRKSRFEAAEIKLEGPGEGIAGKPSNGEMEAKKEEEKKKKKKEEEEEKEIEKKEECKKKEEEEEEEMHEECEKQEECEKKEEEEEEEEKGKKKEKHPHKEETARAAKEILSMHKYEMKKSLEETESLLKSYVEERVKPIEDKLSTILDMVKKIADQPIAPKGVTARTVPLLKSTGEGYVESLSKSEVVSKLLELKKSGTPVDSLDIIKVEMGQDLQSIASKYNLK